MLSASCKYGIRAVIFIASKDKSQGNTGLREIAEKLALPQPYLAKILQTLARKRILNSTKGPHGGFSLIIPPKELSLMNIIDAIDGRNFFDSCYVTGEKCNFDKEDDGRCVLHNDLREEKMRLEKFFSSKTIDQMIDQIRKDPGIRI